MFGNRLFRQNVVANMPMQDGFIDIDNNSGNIDIDLMQQQNNDLNVNQNATVDMNQAPIMEQVQERVVHRTFEHVVPHVCPVRTRIINHHVYKHTYRPQYTCCEENVCENVQCGSCCNY